MIKVLEQAIQKVKALPEEQQRAAAEALELIAAQIDSEPLTVSEIEGVKRAQEEVRNGEIASDAKVRAFFDRFRR